MNFKQIPIIATPITIEDLTQVFKVPFTKSSFRDIFKDGLKQFFNYPYCHFTYSGKSAAYMIFKVLSSLNNRKEVIVPAYTCPTLLTPIKKAGLQARPCDISLDTFQMDVDLLGKNISGDTLSIVPVHLFGLACDIKKINQIGKANNIYVVEDFAQSMGTTIDRRESGTFSKIGFGSFSRGKNLPTYSGGIILTKNGNISNMINNEIKRLPYPSISKRIGTLALFLLFSFIINPYIHKMFHRLILFLKKEDRPVLDLKALQYTDFQAAIGNSILKKFNSYSKKRYENGMNLYERLKGFDFLRLPHMLENSKPAFNRFPVFFNEKSLREKVERKLLKAGIVACRLYTKPVHALYRDLWDGKGPDPCPQASIFAENSLALPTHPLVNEKTLDNIVKIFKKI